MRQVLPRATLLAAGAREVRIAVLARADAEARSDRTESDPAGSSDVGAALGHMYSSMAVRPPSTPPTRTWG